MTLLTTLFLYGAVALGFFLLADGVGYLIENTGGRGESRVRRRLAQPTPEQRESRIEQIARAERAPSASSLGQFLDNLIARADSPLSSQRVLMIMGGLAVLFFIVFFLLTPYLPIAFQILMALGAGVALPIMSLQRQAAKRLAKFQEQFPDALDLIVRSLKVGHPLPIAMQTIAKEVPDPLGSEFAVAARQVTYGKTPPEAIGDLTRRIDLQDLRFFAVATQIHHEAGGNLAEILTGLSKIIRARFQLFRKVKALTAEGRFSAWFLSIFPVFMIFAMNLLQPGYYEKVMDFEYFTHLMVVTFVLLVVNVFAMRMMTKLEV